MIDANSLGIGKWFEDGELNDEHLREVDVWHMFLDRTDHIPNKIIESLIENLADATALNFITVFIKFLADVRIHYNDVLKLRKQARAEINRLEGETVPEPTGTTEEVTE